MANDVPKNELLTDVEELSGPLVDPSLELDFSNKKFVISPTQVGQRLDIDMNDTSSASGGAIIHRVVTFTSGDATPTVANANVFLTTSSTTITDFDDGILGQIITVRATSSITIADGAAIVLAGSADFAMGADDTLTLAMFIDQQWHEISRSDN